MYTCLLRGLAKKGGYQALEVFTPPEPLICAFADCGDNLRVFAMLLYKIGCYGSHAENPGKFRWDRFFDNLQNLSSDIQHVASWMSSTVDFVNRNFSRYISSLLEFNSEQLLRIMTPALLGLPIVENPEHVVGGSGARGRSWGDLEKAGLITLRNRHVELPFIFFQNYVHYLRNQGLKLTGLIDMLNEIRGGPCWRRTEKCDIAVFILHILHWYFTHPNHKTLCLKDLFWGVKGTAASAELKIPEAIKYTDLLGTWPICLDGKFHPDKHLQEGAYIGCRKDSFADSWIVFDSAQGNGKVVLVVKSKQRSKSECLTAKYFNNQKKKVCVDVLPVHLLYTCHISYKLHCFFY